MLLGTILLFVTPMMTGALINWNEAQGTVWVIAMSVLFGPGIYLAGPWRGPLRLWEIRDDRAWITGTGRAFRSQLPELGDRDTRGFEVQAVEKRAG